MVTKAKHSQNTDEYLPPEGYARLIGIIARMRFPLAMSSVRTDRTLASVLRSPALAVAAAEGPLRNSLAELHAKLEINRRALAVQLKACEAVAEIITRAIQDGQSDGTYTALAWGRSRE